MMALSFKDVFKTSSTLLIEIGSTSKIQPNIDVQNGDAFNLLETLKTRP
jgi:hypothetical protein